MRKGQSYMAIMEIENITEGIRHQAEHCRRNDAPCTARIIDAQVALMKSDTAVAAKIRDWPGFILEDAMPLRLAGGFHHLMLTGLEDRLLPIYRGDITDQVEVDAIILAVTQDHDAILLPWFDGPPQTNEAGRSASFMAGLKWLSGKLGPRFELNELGASAGINTMMERYHYDLGGVMAGPENSLMRIKPDWRGAPTPDNPVEIISICGCDQAPIRLADPASALRVKSYVWPENTERITRMDAAIQLASKQAPDVVQADAANWVEARLNAVQAAGVTRVFHHSIVWQYIPENGRKRISQALNAAGERATVERPLAWMMLETNRETFKHELILRYWNGSTDSGQAHLLAEAQAHGAWVNWRN
jgi:hypothetical protein